MFPVGYFAFLAAITSSNCGKVTQFCPQICHSRPDVWIRNRRVKEAIEKTVLLRCYVRVLGILTYASILVSIVVLNHQYAIFLISITGMLLPNFLRNLLQESPDHLFLDQVALISSWTDRFCGQDQKESRKANFFKTILFTGRRMDTKPQLRDTAIEKLTQSHEFCYWHYVKWALSSSSPNHCSILLSILINLTWLIFFVQHPVLIRSFIFHFFVSVHLLMSKLNEFYSWKCKSLWHSMSWMFETASQVCKSSDAICKISLLIINRTEISLAKISLFV